MTLERGFLEIDTESELQKIGSFVRENLQNMKRDKAVVGMSGGIDSSVVASICVSSLGNENVQAIILPEKESNPDSKKFAIKHAERLCIDYEVKDITPVLETIGTYKDRDEVIRESCENYDPLEDRIKITLPENLLSSDALNFFTLTITRDGEEIFNKRLKKKQLQRIIASTDTKQRTRMMFIYYLSERINGMVCGTTNRVETKQGFFVKYGDGGVDVEPIAHLYKCQVYQMGEALDVPREIISREPSPDTFNSHVGDEEFFFRMSYDMVDKLMYCWENNVDIETVCESLNLDEVQVMRAYRDFRSKFNATKHLRELPPSLLV